MKITNTLSVKMNWDSFTFPILVGTPVSTAGVLANDANAVGIVSRTVKQKPDAGDELYLMTGGSIYLSEVAYTDLSVAAMQELDGIDFYKLNGHVQPKGGSGGGGLTPEQEALIQNAQWKSEGQTPLFTETVTTFLADGQYGADLSYSEIIEAPALAVTFDGVEYVCPRVELSNIYGDPDFTFNEFPFSIISDVNGNIIITETGGSHTVSVAVPSTTYINGFTDGVKANVPVAVYNGIISSNESVSGEKFISFLNALVTAGLLEWNTVG